MEKTAFLGVVIALPTVEPGFDGVTVARFPIALYPFNQNVIFDVWTVRDQAKFCLSHISIDSMVYIEGQFGNVFSVRLLYVRVIDITERSLRYEKRTAKKIIPKEKFFSLN